MKLDNIKTCINKLIEKKYSRKEKNLISLSILAIMVVIIAIVLIVKNTNTTLKQDYNIEDATTITKIIVKDNSNRSVVLEKVNDSTWTVNKDYNANMVMVNTLLETFKDVRIREPLPRAARNNVIKDLAADSKKVDIYTTDYFIHWGFIKLFKHQHLNRSFYIGHETQDEMGTYMLKDGDKEPYIAYIPNFRGYLSTRFSTVLDMWRTHTVFKYKENEISKIKIELPNSKQESFELINTGRGFDFKLLESGEVLKQFDTTKVVALLSSFVEMNYERSAKNISKIEKDTIFSRPPSFIVSVTNKQGKTNTLKTFVKLNDPNSIATSKNDFYQIFDINRCYAISSSSKDTLIMQFFVLDNALKPASYFLLKKK